VEADSVELSLQAQKNIDLKTVRIQLERFERTISVPGLIVERPGRSQIDVTAPVGGQVTRVYCIQGEAVMPGQALFDQRLTHEELVNAQSELLRAAEELDVIRREIERLSSVNISGAVPGKTVREREYDQQKLTAVINAQRQSLVLHGLSSDQVNRIVQERKLLQGVTVLTPPFPADGHQQESDHPFHVQELKVRLGQYVDAGNSLCILADHHELFIEGRAFEQEIEHLHRAVRDGQPVSAELISSGRSNDSVKNLKIFYLSDTVDVAARMFPFYIRLAKATTLTESPCTWNTATIDRL
jgi:multidrug efflux pump subunit AcrA (membrane-fusion protein)